MNGYECPICHAFWNSHLQMVSCKHIGQSQTDKKPREFWIEHKLFVDEWIYEAFTSKESCPNKDLIPIHVVEISALLEAQAEIAQLKTAYEDLKNTDWNKHDTANAKLREALKQISGDHELYSCDELLDAQFVARAALGES